jgi:hypothetical protein
MTNVPNPSWTVVALAAVAVLFVGQVLAIPLGLSAVGMEQVPAWFKFVAIPLAILLGGNAFARKAIYPLVAFIGISLVLSMPLGAAVVLLKFGPAPGAGLAVAAISIAVPLVILARDWVTAWKNSRHDEDNALVADGPYCVWWPRSTA